MKKKAFFLLYILFFVSFLISPILSPASAKFDQEIDVTNAIVINTETGETLFEKDAYTEHYPASTTKIVTSILLAERGNLEDVITVSESSAEGLDSDSSSVEPPLVTGESMTLEQLLHCILIASDNRACVVGAEYLSGSESAFVDEMNALASEMGCTNTHFSNCHGLTDSDHYTCAADLAKLALRFFNNETLMEIANKDIYVLPATQYEQERTLETTNNLLNESSPYYYRKANGIKTGFTTPAGFCLVSSAANEDISVIAVVLGGEREEDGTVTSFVACRRLLSWALDAYTKRTLIEEGEIVEEIPVSLSNDRDYVLACAETSLEEVISEDWDLEKLEREVHLDYPDGIDAPVKQGQPLGTLSIYYEGALIGTVPLVSATKVDLNVGLLLLQRIVSFLSNPTLWIIASLLILILFIYLLYVRHINRKR